MGLIREVQEVSWTLNKQEQRRKQKENEKIELENYKKEVESSVKSQIFYYLRNGKNYSFIFKNKDSIIEKIINYIENLKHYDKKTKKYQYLYYGNFDVVTDIEKEFDKQLQKLKKENAEIQKEEKENLINKLQNEILFYFMEYENKKAVADTLEKSENILKLIDDISINDKQKEILLNNYKKIYSKMKSLFAGDIKQQQQDRKQSESELKELYKIEKSKLRERRKKKITKLLFQNYILDIINNIL